MSFSSPLQDSFSAPLLPAENDGIGVNHAHPNQWQGEPGVADASDSSSSNWTTATLRGNGLLDGSWYNYSRVGSAEIDDNDNLNSSNESGSNSSSNTERHAYFASTLLPFGLIVLCTTTTSVASRRLFSKVFVDQIELSLAGEVARFGAAMAMEYWFFGTHQSPAAVAAAAAPAVSSHSHAAVATPNTPNGNEDFGALESPHTLSNIQRLVQSIHWPCCFDALPMAIPPILYRLQAVLLQKAWVELPLGLAYLEAHTKLLVVALVSWCLLSPRYVAGRRRPYYCYSKYQWLCLFIITVSEELDITSDNRRFFWYMASDPLTNDWTSEANAVAMIALAMLCGAVALVYTERIVKQSLVPSFAWRNVLGTPSTTGSSTSNSVPIGPPLQAAAFALPSSGNSASGIVGETTCSIWKRGAQQSFFTMLIWISLLLINRQRQSAANTTSDGRGDDDGQADDPYDEAQQQNHHHVLFHGFTVTVWILVLVQAVIYLCFLWLLFYMGSLYWCLATGTLSYMLSDLVEIALGDKSKLTLTFAIGVALALPAIYSFHMATVRSTGRGDEERLASIEGSETDQHPNVGAAAVLEMGTRHEPNSES